MRAPLGVASGGIAVVILAAAVMSGLSAPVTAATEPTSTGVPIAVIIPELSPTPTSTATSTSTPSPSSSSGGGGTSGGGTSGGGTSGGGTAGGGTTTGTNPDGSPIPPATPSDPAPGLTLDSPTYAARDWVLAIGTGYTPGEKVQFVLYPGAIVLGSYVADASGTVTARIRLPEDTRPGSHVLEATGWASGHVTNREFTVVATAGEPFWLWWVFVVLGVLLLGVIALSIYFRDTIRGWFASPVPVAGSTP